MRRTAVATLLSLALALPAGAAGAAGAQTFQGGRFQPPPDHWMTLDSLSQVLGLSTDQKTKVTPSYTALNGVLKDAAARRAAIRQQMQGQFTPGQPPTPTQRARFDSVRAEMQGFQAEADQWVAAIRNALPAAQQAKFDSLPKPQVVRQRPMGGEARQP